MRISSSCLARVIICVCLLASVSKIHALSIQSRNGYSVSPSSSAARQMPTWSGRRYPTPRSGYTLLRDVSEWSDGTVQLDSPVADTTPESSSSTLRTISRVEKFARLPVWPAWNGALIFILSRIFGQDFAAKLEDSIGGRVCPNFYNPPESTSPFVMLVHHRHSFAPWDPIRYFQRAFILPEGFPAHPHRGFVTVTYILKGGFIHRDSMGVKQTYGAEDRHGGKHTQWLSTGAGILHEEMFDIQPDKGGIPFLQPSSQELYQLWLNLPSGEKMTPPEVELLGGEVETPVVVENGSSTIIIAGIHNGMKGAAKTRSDVTILHGQLGAGAVWKHQLPESHRTVILYMRKGSASIGDTQIPTHHTAYMKPYGSDLVVIADEEGADFLLMAGEPMNEPVSAQGSMVMNHPDQINQAYADYQMGKMGLPWDHKLSDEEWQEHIRKNPSQYTGK